MNYAAYAKCQLSRGDKGDTRVAHISVEISNDTLRVLRSGAAQKRRYVTVSRVRTARGALRVARCNRAAPDICIIFMQPRQSHRSPGQRRAASLLLFPRKFASREKRKEKEKSKEREGGRDLSRGIRQSTPALANPLRTSGRNFAVCREREIHQLWNHDFVFAIDSRDKRRIGRRDGVGGRAEGGGDK